MSRLRAAGCVFAEDEARLLISEASNAAELEGMVRQRENGLPLEQIVGWAEFCGLRLSVAPGVFVPRRRTEFLAAQAIELAARVRHPVVLDLCCGVGAIGAAIAARVSTAELYGADIQSAAVECARRNIGRHGQVFEGDLFEPVPASLRDRIDVLVANAPYVPTAAMATMPPEARLHEAPVTLDGGTDGLDLYRRIAAAAGPWLAPGGHVLLESSQRQGGDVAAIFSAQGLTAKVARFEDSDSTVVIGSSAPSQAAP